MKGAGRFNRSLRSLKPNADLRMAALGALVLLRERLAPLNARIARLKKEREARPAGRPQSSYRLIAMMERYLPQRIGVVATLAMLLASASFGIVKGEHINELVQLVDDSRNALANAAGFRITAVAVNGRKQLNHDEVLALGGISGKSSLLFLDAAVVRDKLKANPWISDANVLKLYPGRLQIDITERTAFALWQQDGRLSVIADDGSVLEPYVARRFTALPLVVGKGADTAARDFLALVDRYPQVRSQLRAAIFVAERRWNLRLKDDLDIRLPENDVGNALATLTRLDKDDRLLSRDITAIDMRLPDRITVRLSEDAAKARDELFKDKKPKKKAGDA